MVRVPASAFERRLLVLDRDALAAFVADLWRECGWTVAAEGALLEATRGAETRRLFVLPPRRLLPGLRSVTAPEGTVDAVVSARRIDAGTRLPRGIPDAPVEDADDLRDRLLYALGDATRRDLLARHLGYDVRASGTAATDPSVLDRPLPAVDVPASTRPVLASLGVLLLVVGTVALLGATGGVPAPGATGTANATQPAAAGVHATVHSDVYDVDRTCDRDPREIAVAASDALRGPDLDRGLVVLGEFWNPRHVRGVPADEWNEMMVDDALHAFRRADEVDVGGAAIEPGVSARVRVTALENDTRSAYDFRFSYRTEQPYADCWVIDYFGPAESRS